MRAVLRNDPNVPGRVAKGNQILSVESRSDRRAIGLGQLLAQHKWCPEAPTEFPHEGSFADAAEQLVVL